MISGVGTFSNPYGSDGLQKWILRNQGSMQNIAYFDKSQGYIIVYVLYYTQLKTAVMVSSSCCL